MSFENPGGGIPLATHSDCPQCRRPLLSLATDACGFCGHDLEERFQQLPEVASRLTEIARSWTPDTFLEWMQPRPAQILWALSTGHWRNLGHWVAEDLWRCWARLFANLNGRWATRIVDDLQLESIRICGLGEFEPWVKVRILGQRIDFQSNPYTQEVVRGCPESLPFREIWTLVPTGEPIEKAHHQCTECGGGLDFVDTHCPYCTCPVIPVIGPWKLASVRAESLDQMPFRTPFEGSAFSAVEPRGLRG